MTLDAVARRFFELTVNDGCFDEMSETVVNYQFANNPVFRRYCQNLGIEPARCYLPIRAFKESVVATFDTSKSETVFLSSGTSQSQRSKHFIKSLEHYRRSVREGFVYHFGAEPRNILGHLPGFEQTGGSSSLVTMVEELVRTFGLPDSGRFLSDSTRLESACARGEPVLLFGAAFGLLSLGEASRWKLPEGSILIETGGMKTHRREMSRSDLHDSLATYFGIEKTSIWSEYGMAELMSQAYRPPSGAFSFPPWVRWELFDPEDPTRQVETGKPGLLGIRDLANLHSVANILTEDLAVEIDGGFEVLGRLKGSDLRGCNLLIEAYL